MNHTQAILFVHGHMGSPKQFASLISALGNVQADIYNITLPGHDAAISDFTRSNDADWQNCVDDWLKKLGARYESIISVGHSMGGLLLINAANAEKVNAIVAIALPLRIKLSFTGIKTRILSLTKPKARESVSVSYARAMCGVYGLSVWNAYRLIPNTIRLLKVMRKARAKLPALQTKTIIINSHNDEIVSSKSVEYAKMNSQSVTFINLNRASHFWYPDDEIYVIARQIIELLNT